MIKRWLIIDLIGWCLLALFIYLLPSCSPQKRLNRLIKNNPELAITDTIYSTKTVEVKGFHLDTAFKASTNVNGIYEIIEHYKDVIDSLNRVKLTKELVTYVPQRLCLDDTFTVQLLNNGYCKVWQQKNGFHFKLNQPAQKIKFEVKTGVNQFNVVTKNDWLMYWLGISTILFILVVLFFLKMWLKF